MLSLVPSPAKIRQPRHYAAFQCIGAACEDTCCNGWGVVVDRETYDKYRECRDPDLKASLEKLIQIDGPEASDDRYATIQLSGTQCPFLSEGLCSIQMRLGEAYLAKTCATFPRVMNLVDGVLEKSLELSCPEASRLALLNPGLMEFEDIDRGQHTSRIGHLASLDTSASEYPDKPYLYFPEIRRLILSLLQTRAYPLWKRLVLLGYLCDKLHELASGGSRQDIPRILQGYAEAIQGRLFDEDLSQYRARPEVQIEIALELMVSRIGSDFTPERFLSCYRDFMRGIGWTPESTMDSLGATYADACSQYYAPFMNEHEYMLEHYLVNYAYRTLFPFGPQESQRPLGLHGGRNTVGGQYRLMIAYYAVIKALLIGIAGVRKSTMGAGDLIKVVQSCAKTFEHSLAYPNRALQILAGRGMTDAASMAVLILN